MGRKHVRTSHGWVDLVARMFVGVSMGWMNGMFAGGVFLGVTGMYGWIEWGLFDWLAPLFYGSIAGAAVGLSWFAADFPVPRLRRGRRRPSAAGAAL